MRSDKNHHPVKYLPWWRRVLKLMQAESIPWPGSFFYNAVSKSEIFQKHYELMAKDIIRYCPQGKLLDIGTGPGWLLIQLAQRAEDLELTGLDISAAMVAKANENITTENSQVNICVEQGSADLLPYPANLFDMVVSTQSLHHWKKPVQSFNEIYRVLKNGGQARIYDIVTDIPPNVFKSAAKEFGRLRLLMLWLHVCEEPFYSQQGTLDLAFASDFREGTLEFTGILCCLKLKKDV